MKQNMMRIAVAATLGLSAFAASAGTIAVNVGSVLAAEYVTDAVAIAQPTVTFQTTNLLNAGSIVYLHVRFSAGVVAAPGAVTPTVSEPLTAAATGAAAVTVDTDKKGYSFPVKVGANGLAAGSTISIPATPGLTLTGLAAALGNGGSVSTSIGYTSTVGDFSVVSTWIETPTTANVLTSAKALSSTVLSSAVMGNDAIVKALVPAGKNETAVVDIQATILKAFTNNLNVPALAAATTVNLGYLRLNLASGIVKPVTLGATDPLDFGNLTATVTGDFSAPAVSAVNVTSDATCATSLIDATANIAADGKSVKITGLAASDAANGVFVCYTVDTATKNIVAPIQYVLGDISVESTATTAATTQAGGNLYKLATNGASVFVPSFVPTTGALGSGYNTYLRIVNTGNQTADISGFGYNQSTGVAGTPAVIAPALAPKASVVLSTDAITSALGLAAGWSSLQVTGATSDLAVQPLLVNPQGVITNIGGANK